MISSGARVERSVVADGSYIGEGAELVDALVGRSSYVQARARVLERSALGDDVIVGEGATISPDVKVFPNKTVESGANITQSLIHETMGLRTVFKGGVVKGKFNVDLTPEFFIRLASSFGTALDPGAVVTLGRDASLSAQVAKRAMTSALLGTGVNVRDLRAAHAGVVRHDVLAGKSSAGAHLRAGEDPDDVEVLFFSSNATPIPESEQRDVEKVFVREEYRRAYANDVGELIYPGRAVEQYVERLERATDRGKTSGATMVVDFSGGVASLVASRAFSRLGINAVVMQGFANANVVGGRTRPRFEESLARVSQIVPMMEASFGCVVGPTGEDVQFVDDRGEFVPPDVMLACLVDQAQPSKVVLPINLSDRYRDLDRGPRRNARREPHRPGQRRPQRRRNPGGPRRYPGRQLHLPKLPASPGLFRNVGPHPRTFQRNAALPSESAVRRQLRQRGPGEAGMSVVRQRPCNAGLGRTVRRGPGRDPHRRSQAQPGQRLGLDAPGPGQPHLSTCTPKQTAQTAQSPQTFCKTTPAS